MNILDRYVMRSILGSVLLVASVLLVLGALFIFIDQQEDIGSGNYTAIAAVWYTLLSLPQQVFELLPITALIGSLLGLGSLARGSELTVIRATGVSIAHLAGMAFLAGLVLVGVAVVLGSSGTCAAADRARAEGLQSFQQRQLRQPRRGVGARWGSVPARLRAVR